MSPERCAPCRWCTAPSVGGVQLSGGHHVGFVPPPPTGLPHGVPGAGAGESQSGAGHEDRAAAPAGEEADGGGQAGESRARRI